MNFFRRLFWKKAKCYTYAIARNEEEAVHDTASVGGTQDLSEALIELMQIAREREVQGPWKLYHIEVSVDHEVQLGISVPSQWRTH